MTTDRHRLSLREHQRAPARCQEPSTSADRDGFPGQTVPRKISRIFAPVLPVLLAVLPGCRHHHGPDRSKASHQGTGPTTTARNQRDSQNLDISILEVQAMGRPRKEMRFYRGETLDCIMQISGFDAPKGKLHLLSSMTMTLPNNGILWKEAPKTLVDQPIPPGHSRKVIRLKLGLRLSTAEPAGRHRLLLRIEEPETHRYGTAALDFEVKGRRLRRSSKLTIQSFRPPSPLDLRPGGTLHLSLWVGGFRTKGQANGRHSIHLAGRITWRRKDQAASGEMAGTVPGKVVPDRRGPHRSPGPGEAGPSETFVSRPFRLAFEDLRFVPAQVPVLLTSRVPRKLGRYDLTITLWDAKEENKPTGDQGAGAPAPLDVASRTVHDIPVQPAGLGIYDMQVLGLGDSPVHRFFRGQTLKVAFEVWGPKPRDLVGDLAVEGPDGGIYFLKKDAFQISKSSPLEKTAFHRRIQVPMELPRYCPVGKYHLLVRLRSRDGKQSASRQVSFIVEGRPLPPLPVLAITDWSLGTGNMLLPILSQGQDVPVLVVVGGMHMENSPPASHRLDLVLNILLRDKEGHLLSKEPEAAHISRTLTFVPRRVPLKATWRVPGNVSGLALLQVEVEDLLTHKVTVSQKKIIVHTN